MTFLPDGDIPDPDAEVLRGIRSARMLIDATKDAERCGIDKDEIAAATKVALGPSTLRITELPAESDASLVYWVGGASAKDRCVLVVQWYLHGPVLSRKDRRDSYATLAHNTTLIEFSPKDVSGGRSMALGFVEREMRELSKRWSKVNRSR